MKVFVFGSKIIQEIPEEFLDIIDNLCDNHHHFLVGDCSGVDAAVASYLVFNKGWSDRLTMYHVDECRNQQYGIHHKKKIEVPEGFTGNKYHIKDNAMIEDCDYAIGLWDGKSKGSQRNINKLIRLNKPLRVIFTGDEE